MTIREYIETDWPYLCEIHDLARIDELTGSVDLGAFLTLEQTYESEGLFAGEVWVASEEEIPVGFVAFADHELTWLYVHPAQYKKGIGRALLEKAIERCNGNISTEVLSGNKSALNLYLSEGFKITSVKKGKLTGNEAFEAEGILLSLDPIAKSIL
jgi:GNAT superfamily N-acetyltransferase